ncbi:hypothetical protein DL1_21090 [Thioclava dalianensis]|uniref:Uncharacterized protein n=1 Tax=Thioclava dalianensis TaxID=1185766 RepID=A0A074TLX7_9RHOB|nr:hypothetical protein [Thioclava dalianensis]KEP69998.1 hypothetical protein DL1_21090 [Thioclava dalianensis]SFN18566.1 hypothetical protein SAMN05216224_102866 [Thioclava dalianensis]
MTQAILPMNLRALRVNANDAQVLTSRFKGRVAQFEMMPYSATATRPSTGTAIVQPLESSASPIVSLKPGLHLHWELPDAYKRGVQGPEGGTPVFPHAPNTWLVVRYLQRYDETTQSYGPVETQSWIVESDYIAGDLQLDATGITRPAISVPLPDQPAAGEQPYRFMGRVVPYEAWTGPGPSSDYLSGYAPHYLTSVGFVGPSFASYYPECNSVFGFWDHFADLPDIYAAIQSNSALQFRVSYHVTGWVRDAQNDLFADFPDRVRTTYNAAVAAAAEQKVPPSQTPAQALVQLAQQDFRLGFNAKDIAYTLNPDKTLATLDAPDQGLCSGVMQEIVWNMEQNPGETYFLNNPEGQQPNALWSDNEIRLAVGNTTVEGLSALIKGDLAPDGAGADQLASIEMLLDALQLGLLHDLEGAGNSLMVVDEALHSRGFAKQFGGYVWSLVPTGRAAKDDGTEVSLPLPLAELLHNLNAAQKTYDQGRAELDTLRKQLFMDWLRYISAYIDPAQGGLQIPINDLASFLDNNSPNSELGYVVTRGHEIGMQSYVLDPVSGEITGLNPPPSAPNSAQIPSQADAVFAAWQAVRAALPDAGNWLLQATPAPAFWEPTDPVLVMEGDRIEPVRRNGTASFTPARLSAELITQLTIEDATETRTLEAATITGPPALSAVTPLADPLRAILAESCLFIPMLAGNVAQAAIPPSQSAEDATQFSQALNQAQGGLSPLDPGPAAAAGNLYDRLHATGAGPLENPTQPVTAPLALTFGFTNATQTGWTPYGTALTTQTALTEFSATRFDPFLPVFLLWQAQLDPLARDPASNYTPDSLTRHFSLDPDAIDYIYAPDESFTTGTAVRYGGSVTLSRQPTRSLTAQIDQYEKLYPHDAVDDALNHARAVFEQAQIMSQGIGGFGQEQLLRSAIARVPVEDLIKGGRDAITAQIDAAARSLPYDNWYNFAFNGVSPISQGLLAEDNFGPFRAGFSRIFDLEIVDTFGQRMTLQTRDMRPDGSQNAQPAFPLAPVPGDQTHQGSLYLPPRLLAPSRVWFQWLSARFDTKVKGITDDFVEMNSHPASSPICGIVLPNHLDDSLMFYQPEGALIGSFSVEHGTLVYRTRAGNADNPDDSLAQDIGPQSGPALVNEHLFDVMWHIDTMGAGFLTDMMTAIRRSEGLVNPASYAQNVALGVLFGQPLVITRAVVGIETLGGVLPVSQADTVSHPAFSDAVTQGRYRYSDREETGASELQSVALPIRLGNLANMNDGMIGYFLDGAGGASPYGTFYAPTAPAAGKNGVVPPAPDTLEVTLNQKPVALTFLMDPRGAIHATTGILPVQQIAIPSDQYAQTLQRLQVTFETRPVLSGAGGLTLPLPQEAGYDWSWVQTNAPSVPLGANAGTETATFNYTPQSLREGWTRLQRAPSPPAPQDHTE